MTRTRPSGRRRAAWPARGPAREPVAWKVSGRRVPDLRGGAHLHRWWRRAAIPPDATPRLGLPRAADDQDAAIQEEGRGVRPAGLGEEPAGLKEPDVIDSCWARGVRCGRRQEHQDHGRDHQVPHDRPPFADAPMLGALVRGSRVERPAGVLASGPRPRSDPARMSGCPHLGPCGDLLDGRGLARLPRSAGAGARPGPTRPMTRRARWKGVARPPPSPGFNSSSHVHACVARPLDAPRRSASGPTRVTASDSTGRTVILGRG